MPKKIIVSLSILCVVIGAIFTVNGLILAWNSPTCDPNDDPSSCNVPTPLNVSEVYQTKQGGLVLQMDTEGSWSAYRDPDKYLLSLEDTYDSVLGLTPAIRFGNTSNDYSGQEAGIISYGDSLWFLHTINNWQNIYNSFVVNREGVDIRERLIARKRVGIGTINPDYALDVNGKIRMQNQTTDSDPDDIVVTKGYMDSSSGTPDSDILFVSNPDEVPYGESSRKWRVATCPVGYKAISCQDYAWWKIDSTANTFHIVVDSEETRDEFLAGYSHVVDPSEVIAGRSAVCGGYSAYCQVGCLRVK